MLELPMWEATKSHITSYDLKYVCDFQFRVNTVCFSCTSYVIMYDSSFPVDNCRDRSVSFILADLKVRVIYEILQNILPKTEFHECCILYSKPNAQSIYGANLSSFGGWNGIRQKIILCTFY